MPLLTQILTLPFLGASMLGWPRGLFSCSLWCHKMTSHGSSLALKRWKVVIILLWWSPMAAAPSHSSCHYWNRIMISTCHSPWNMSSSHVPSTSRCQDMSFLEDILACPLIPKSNYCSLYVLTRELIKIFLHIYSCSAVPAVTLFYSLKSY